MFRESDIAALLHSDLAQTVPARRKLFYKALIAVRRRQQKRVEGAPVAQLFHMPDQWTLIKAKAWEQRIRSAIMDQGIGLRDAFHMFDSDGNDKLSASELFGALNWLGLPGVTARDVLEFMVILDSDQDAQVSWQEFATLLKEPEGSEGQKSLKPQVAREDLPEHTEAYGKEELEKLRKEMSKQAEQVQSEQNEEAEKERLAQIRWQEQFEEQQAWTKRNPRAQWFGSGENRYYQITYDFNLGEPPAKMNSLGICTTEEDCMLLEKHAHIIFHTDLRVANCNTMAATPENSPLTGHGETMAPPMLTRSSSGSGSNKGPGPPPLLQREASRPSANGGSQSKLNIYTISMVMKVPEMPKEDIAIFKTVHSKGKEGIVYLTPNGTLKVSGTEGKKILDKMQLDCRNQHWPVKHNRWCAVTIVMDLTNTKGAKFRGYIDGIDVLTWTSDDMNVDGMFSLPEPRVGLFQGPGGQGMDLKRYIRTLEFETKALSAEQVLEQHERMLTAAYESEMLKSEAISAGNIDSLVNTCVGAGLADGKHDTLREAFYIMWNGSGISGPLPDAGKVCGALTKAWTVHLAMGGT